MEITELKNGLGKGLQRADDLWNNMSENMISFIINHGSSASHYFNAPINARTNWAQVKQYLLGNITSEQLKQLLGC